MRNEVRRTNRNWLKQFEKKIVALGKKEVAVGFPAGKGLGTPYYKTGASVIQVAIWNNYGTRRIPPRPFFDLGAIRIQRELHLIADADIRLCLQGKLDATTMMNQWGVKSKGIIQEQILNTSSPPDAPRTIAKKGSAHPLIDTGHMMQSVTYVIRKRSA